MEDNSGATHEVFFRAVKVERYRLIQMTAFSITAAYCRNFSLELKIRHAWKQQTSSAVCYAEAY